jgi:hypothetical protein
MKKILSLLAFSTLLALGANAQGVSGGLKLGLNLAGQTMSSNGITVSPSMRPTIHAGGYLTLMLSEKFGVQPELLYSGQGYKDTGVTLKANYLAVPILLRLNFTEVFSIHLGPQMGFLLSAKMKYEGEGETEDVKEYLKGTDFGAALGLGIDLPMGLNFGARFVKGFSNVADTNGDLKYKNFALQAHVGYKLFGKK